MSLLVWLIAAAISFCGLAAYIDLGTAMPRSGGEKVYLERIFRRPKFLASCIFMSYVVLLGFSTPNCIVLGEYAMYALGVEANQWNVRIVAVVSVTAACWVHARSPRLGLTAINVLGAIKMLIIAMIGMAGVYSVFAKVGMHDEDPTTATFKQNYSTVFTSSTHQPYAYATAILKALYCFRGYNTANQVLSEVRDPVPTLKKAAPAALSIVTVAYVITNLAYFAAVERTDIRSSGVVVAGHFFANVCGEMIGAHVLPVLIILSAFGSIAATSFAQARVNQEIAKEGLLPFASFFAKSSAFGTPAAGLFLHWLVSVIVIVVPPPGEIYAFLVTLGAYPVSVLAVLVAGGLLYLQNTPAEKWSSPAPAPTAAVVTFLLANVALIILPWIPPAGCRPIHTSFPSYAYPAGGCAVLAVGVVYWVWWARGKVWGKGANKEEHWRPAITKFEEVVEE
jgi:amino acid transporter